MARSEDYAWAAGFIDGEGTFSANRSTQRRVGGNVCIRSYFRLTVSQKNKALLHRLVDIFGVGSLHPDGDCWRYFVGSKNAFGVADSIWPWLGEQKKADFKRALHKVRESRLAYPLEKGGQHGAL